MPPIAFPIGGENYMRNARPIFNRYGARLNSGQPTASFRQAYPASVDQTGEDYSSIMKGYKDILEEPQDRGLDELLTNYRTLFTRPSPAASRLSYSQDPNVAESLGILKNLSTTGGLSEGDVSNIRARGVSPIRSVYANMQRNLDRQRALTGGYSPNYGAVSAKMAREMSEQAAEASTGVEARIAEMIQQGKLASAPQFASFAEREAGAKRDVDRFNAEATTRAGDVNTQRQLAALTGMRDILSQPDKRLEALRGMTSIYGTTPALAATFGNQALQAAELQQRAAESAQRTGVALASQIPQRPAAPVVTPRRNILGPQTKPLPMKIGFRGRRLGG